jgi:prepilin-type N-terminal cleavage/methylation domain-containing protein
MRTVLRRGRAGFTLIELMVAMVVGVLVLSAATGLALTTFRSIAGIQLRDGIDRNARFIGLSLQRDLTETGVDIESLPNFGSLAVYGDTIAILRVPYEPTAAQPYPLSQTNFPTGLCGPACAEIQTGGVAPGLAVGDLARFQVNNTRRLIRITGVSPVGGGYQVTWGAETILLHHDAGIAGLVVSAPASFIQKLAMVAYWRQGTQLMRAERLTNTGAPSGEVIADGVQAFTVTLLFTDGDEYPEANGTDADGTNDYDDIAGIRIRSILQADRADPRVNGGVLLTRNYEWFVAPRNLIYERNRL